MLLKDLGLFNAETTQSPICGCREGQGSLFCSSQSSLDAFCISWVNRAYLTSFWPYWSFCYWFLITVLFFTSCSCFSSTLMSIYWSRCTFPTVLLREVLILKGWENWGFSAWRRKVSRVTILGPFSTWREPTKKLENNLLHRHGVIGERPVSLNWK